MSTISQLETILTRFQNCPLNLFRVELDMFLQTLTSDVHLNSLLTEICRSNEQMLGAKASTFVKNIPSSAWSDLKDFNSASLRAAFCYQLCQCLIGESSTIMCGKNVVAIGTFYGQYQGRSGQLSSSEAIRIFSDLFLQPLVSYLRSATEIRHRILMLLSRYRQRSEWFTDKTEIKTLLDGERNLEKALKIDFLRYLFDNGIDFSVESQYPPGGGEVDVLAVLPELGPLPIEVKVFDGGKRGASYISGGLAQAAEYAKKFNSSETYYIVYNVAENRTLSLPGISVGFNVVRVQLTPVTVYSIVVNLGITLPASQAKSLESVSVSLPQVAH